MFLRFRREIALGLAAAALLTRRARWPLAAMAIGTLALPRSLRGYSGKTVVITGGSRGLGLALARKLLRECANVALIARDTDELERAEQMLCDEFRHARSHLCTFVCDVTDCEHLDTTLAEVRARFGQIDVLINNAGSIMVAPFHTLDDDDFRAQIDLHLKAVVNATRLVRPYFHMAGKGAIVNVSSLGGLIPVPHMSAYCASKFALGGFSEAAAAELARENITVTTVYPGLMRTGSPIQAVFKGDHAREFAWFASADNAPLLSISADQAARRILAAVLDGRRHVILTAVAQLGYFARVLLPETFHALTQLTAKALPEGTSRERQTGAMSASDFPQLFSDRQSASEKALNQKESRDAEFNLGLRHRPQT